MYQVRHRGFTLIEITVVIGILLLIGGVGLFSSIRSRNTREVIVAGQGALSTILLAQSQSLGGEDNMSWGVRIEQYQLIVFRGTSYASSTATTSYPMPPDTEIVNIMLAGGGQDMLFKRLTGETDQFGTILVRSTRDTSETFSITIERSGSAYRTGSTPVYTATRIVDARHRAFTLGWSIKTAATLTLTFANPPGVDIVQNIAMNGYFDAMQTKFDWSGTIPVGGADEVLRIHTTALDDFNTTLSIDRDCRKNRKQLAITIDGKSIATYGADCRTVTIGGFGGVMSEP